MTTDRRAVSAPASGRPPNLPATEPRQSVDLFAMLADQRPAVPRPDFLNDDFERFVEAIPIGLQVYQVDELGGVYLTLANWAADRILGVDHAHWIGQPIERVFPELVTTDRVSQFRDVALTGTTVRTHCVAVSADAVRFSVEIYAFQLSVGRLTLAIIDITEREHKARSLHKLSLAVEQSPAIVVITDSRGIVEYANPKFEQVTGLDLVDVIGADWTLLFQDPVGDDGGATLGEAIADGKPWRGELTGAHPDGQTYWLQASVSPLRLADDRVTHFVAVKEDITLRKAYETKLLRQATIDELTNLPNRYLVIDRLNQAIMRARREGTFVTIAFIDLDNFKIINDTLGHRAGDDLLVEAAHRLGHSVRLSDTVGRLGGDEFLLILSDLKSIEHSQLVVGKILDAFSTPFLLEGHEIVVTASIGVATFPTDGIDAQTLMQNADTAMYDAKDSGRNTYCFFRPDMNEAAMRRLSIETRLRAALRNNELFMVYQPVVDCRSGQPVGVEALVRWKTLDLGAVPPEEFIGIAEQTGLINELGEFVLTCVCREARRWTQGCGRPLRISVNVSSRQFRGHRLVDLVTSQLAEHGIPNERFELELTERVIVDDHPDVQETIDGMRALGVRLAVDDFGTGFSSLNYLQRIRVDALKIDKSFVQRVDVDPGSAALTRAIVVMAHSLNIEVVAEGVETRGQLDFLRQIGCDHVQGYLIARPMTPDTFDAWRRAQG